MRQILIIAQREFFVTITRKGYIFAVVGMPLFFLAIGGVGYWSGRLAERKVGGSSSVGLIDRAHIVDLSLAATLPPDRAASFSFSGSGEKREPIKFVAYPELERAVADLKQGHISACYVVEADYVATGKITIYTPEGGLFSDLTTPGQGDLHKLLRASLMKGRIEGPARDRVLDPSNLEQMKVTEQGQIKAARGGFEEMAEFLAPFGMFLLLTMAIFLSSGYLLQGIAEEKQSRVIEVLLSSVRPTRLLTGKILGLGAAGLLQVAFYVGLLIVPATAVFAFIDISVGKIALSFVYFVLGYLLFASLMAGTGTIGNTVQESSQISVIWTMTSMIPMFLLAPLSEAPNSILARALSFFPLTAPVTMLLRISSAKVPTVDIVISIGALVLGIYLSIKGAAKLFRVTSLMYGKRPSLPELIRWMREA